MVYRAETQMSEVRASKTEQCWRLSARSIELRPTILLIPPWQRRRSSSMNWFCLPRISGAISRTEFNGLI